MAARRALAVLGFIFGFVLAGQLVLADSPSGAADRARGQVGCLTSCSLSSNAGERLEANANGTLDAITPQRVAVGPPLHSILADPPRIANSLMVRAENAQPGTVGWKITNFAVAGELQAYAGSQSVNAGGAVDLYVSSRLAGTKYQLEVFRMGWYGGLGARLMLTVGGLQARAQGYYAAAVGIAGCPTCRREASTGLIDAGWQPSYHLSVPQAWLSGAYLLKLTESHGKQTYVPLVVRQDDRASALLLQTSVNTYEAYNAWGGKSLYDSNSSGAATVGGGTAAVKVSFNRPYEADFGSGHFLRYEYNLIRWIERQGYDVTYTTDADVAVDGTQLLRHRALIAAGHDEYWTAEQRQHVEEALSQGVHLAFLGADDVYWQARYEASAEAVPYRTLVVYRGHSDPLFSTDLAHTTVRWRDQPVTKPENSLTGTSYGGQLNPFVQDWVAAGTANWLFAGAWLRPGDKVPGLVGKEYDHSVNNEASPKGLQILSHSPVSTNGGSGTDGYAETTVYTAPSGAMVFGAGTVTWSWGLDDASYPLGALHSTPVSAAIQRITANLLDYFAYGPPDPP